MKKIKFKVGDIIKFVGPATRITGDNSVYYRHISDKMKVINVKKSGGYHDIPLNGQQLEVRGEEGTYCIYSGQVVARLLKNK